MSAPNLSTWDLASPRRPGSADFNGAALQNHPQYPPDTSMPTAELLNTQSLTAVSAGKVVANLTLSVKYAAGSPTLDSFTSPASGPTSGTFTIARHGGGAGSGDIDITWPANTFPAPVAQPKAWINGTTPGGITISAITNGVRVVAVNMANVATDLAFTFDLM